MNDSIDLGGLLTIDVDSELRKLSGAQLQGPWQIPAEFVRRALKAGATAVDIRIERNGVVITDDGQAIGPDVLQWAATLLDASKTNEQRHAALTALESTGGLVFLVVAGLRPKYFRVVTGTGSEQLVLEFRGQGAPLLSRVRGNGHPGSEVSIRAPGLDRRQITHWLTNVCRFAPSQIRIDGEPIANGFETAAVHGTLTGEVRGRIAIPLEGETAHLWLLEHGLVTGHLTVPDAPCFEAAIELGSDATDLNASRLRESVGPQITNLVEQAALLLAAIGHRSASLPEALRGRIAALLLQALRRRVGVDHLVKVPIFRVVDGDGHGFCSLVDLKQACGRNSTGVRTLAALYPTQRPDRFALGSGKVLVADTTERCRLAELINVRFRPPNPRDASGSIVAWFTRALNGAGRALSQLGSRVLHPLGGTPVPEGALSPEEHHFIAMMRDHLCESVRSNVSDCVLATGSGPIRHTTRASGRLVLPRSNPVVRAAVAAVSADENWAYLAALAILDGHGLPSSRSRGQWLRESARM